MQRIRFEKMSDGKDFTNIPHKGYNIIVIRIGLRYVIQEYKDGQITLINDRWFTNKYTMGRIMRDDLKALGVDLGTETRKTWRDSNDRR